MRNYKDKNGVLKTAEIPVYSIPGEKHDIIINPSVSQEISKADSFDFTMHITSEYYNSILHMKTLFRVEYDEDTIFFGRVLTIDITDMQGTKKVHCEGALSFMNDVMYPGTPDKERPKQTGVAYINSVLAYYNSKCDSYKQIQKGYIPGNYTGDNDSEHQVDLSEEKKHGSSSWSPVATVFNNMQSQYGGYIRARYDRTSGNVYLDWYKNYFRKFSDSHTTLELGVNLLEVSSNVEVNNIFTVLIPIGKGSNGKPLYLDSGNSATRSVVPADPGGDSEDPSSGTNTGNTGTNPSNPSSPSSGSNTQSTSATPYNPTKHPHYPNAITIPELALDYSTNPPQTPGIFTPEQLTQGYMDWTDYRDAISKYGLIFKTQSFDNATTVEQLWNYAIDYMKNNYKGGYGSITVKAIDLHMLPEFQNAHPKIVLGDQVKIRYPDGLDANGDIHLSERTWTCKSIKYDLQNPENTSYVIGVPSEMLDHEYGSPKNSGGGGGGGPNTPSTHSPEDATEEDLNNVINYIQAEINDFYGYDALQTFYENNTTGMTFWQEDPAQGDATPMQGISFGTFIDGGVTYGIGMNAQGVFIYDPSDAHITNIQMHYNGSEVRIGNIVINSENDLITLYHKLFAHYGEPTDAENPEDPPVPEIQLDGNTGTILAGNTGEPDPQTGEPTFNVGINVDTPVVNDDDSPVLDEHGDPVTQPGGIIAQDISIPGEIPSFKTKLALIDRIIAVDITTDTITINTSQNGLNLMVNGHAVDIGTAFVDVSVVYLANGFTLTFDRANGNSKSITVYTGPSSP